MLLTVLGAVVVLRGKFAEGILIQPPEPITTTRQDTSPSISTLEPQPIKSAPLHTNKEESERLSLSTVPSTSEDSHETTGETEPSGGITEGSSPPPDDGGKERTGKSRPKRRVHKSSALILFPIVSVIIVCFLLGLLVWLSKQNRKNLIRKDSTSTVVSTASVINQADPRHKENNNPAIQTISLSSGLVMAIGIKDQATSSPENEQKTNVTKALNGNVQEFTSAHDGVVLEITTMDARLANTQGPFHKAIFD